MLITSCSNTVKKELSDGEYTIGKYKNDSIKNGLFTTFYKDGTVQRKMRYRNNTPIGTMKYYYPTGKINSIYHFVDGKAEGKLKGFHENGKPSVIHIYKNNKLIDVEKCYDAFGHSLDCGTLKNGNGTLNQYKSDGKLFAITYFKKGEYQRTDSIK